MKKLHFKTTQERLNFLRGKFTEIKPKEVKPKEQKEKENAVQAD